MATIPERALECTQFSTEERAELLQIARAAIAAAIARQRYDAVSRTPRLAEPRAVFTTLRMAPSNELRGCVGHVMALEPLTRAIAQTAASAALHDPRFTPLTAAELPNVRIELSVLSPLAPVLAEHIEVGRHGVLVIQGSKRGLLLPEVPLGFGWGREMFLAQVCRKAGLTTDAWRAGAELLAFTTEKFAEE